MLLVCVGLESMLCFLLVLGFELVVGLVYDCLCDVVVGILLLV